MGSVESSPELQLVLHQQPKRQQLLAASNGFYSLLA